MGIVPELLHKEKTLKILTVILSMLFMFISSSWCQTLPARPLPSPDEILAMAKKGRFEYIDALYTVRNGFEREPTFEQVAPYLKIIEPLAQIESTLGFPIFQIKPIEELGDFLCTKIIKNFDLSLPSKEYVDIFLKWSDYETKNAIIDWQNVKVRKFKYNKEQVTAVFLNSSYILDYLENVAVGPRQPTIDSAQHFQSSAFQSMIALNPMLFDEKTFGAFVTQLRTADAFDFALNFYREYAAKLQKADDLKKLINIVMLVSQTKDSRFPPNPLMVNDYTGEIIVHTIFSIIREGETIDIEILKNARKYLEEIELDQITFQIQAAPFDRYTLKQYPLMAELAKLAIAYLDKNRMALDKFKLEKFLSKILLGLELSRNNIEGLYKVKMMNTEVNLTIVRFGLANIAVTLAQGEQNYLMSAVNGFYDDEQQLFEVIKFDDAMDVARTDRNSLSKIVFKINRNTIPNTIEGYFDNGLRQYSFNGERSQSYLSFPSSPLSPLNQDGLYEGYLGSQKVQLALNKRLDGTLTGSLTSFLDESDSDQKFFIGFQNSFIEDGKLCMTNKSLQEDAPTKHIRGIFKDDGSFVGEYIVGGSFQSHPLNLTRK